MSSKQAFFIWILLLLNALLTEFIQSNLSGNNLNVFLYPLKLIVVVFIQLLLILLKIPVTPFSDVVIDLVGILLTEFDKLLSINFQIIAISFFLPSKDVRLTLICSAVLRKWSCWCRALGSTRIRPKHSIICSCHTSGCLVCFMGLIDQSDSSSYQFRGTTLSIKQFADLDEESNY